MKYWKRSCAGLVVGIGVLLGACGDGGSDDPTATATATATASGGAAQTQQPPSRPTVGTTPTRQAGSFGPEPTFGDYVKVIFPAHAQRIAQVNTRSPNPLRPGGVCAEVSFEGLPENTLWFRFAMDGVEYTTELVWVVPTEENPTEGKMCYAPEDGFEVGRHTVAIVVANPTNSSEPEREVVDWSFEVTE